MRTLIAPVLATSVFALSAAPAWIRVFMVVAALAALGGCGGGVMQRFPDDVQASFAHGDMRRLETERFVIYYPAHRRAEIDRFLVRAERCANVLRDAALVKWGTWKDKMVIAMPDTSSTTRSCPPVSTATSRCR
jgi:hypothetical protein